MRYLGIEPKELRVGVFDFTGCEGCQLQLANKEESLVPFLESIKIVNFREISSDASQEYDIAFIEGSITRSDEISRLTSIRQNAKILVALGSCACFGGVNRLKNSFNLAEANREVYGEHQRETLPTRAVSDIVPLEMEIPGCPVNKAEVERIVQHLIWDLPFSFPVAPVCHECKQQFTTCLFDLGRICLGPITMAGCGAPCPAGGLGCWGCRGPAESANFEEFFSLVHDREFSEDELNERLSFFGAFEGAKNED